MATEHCRHGRPDRCRDCWWEDVVECVYARRTAIREHYRALVDRTPVVGVLAMASALAAPDMRNGRPPIDLKTLPLDPVEPT